MDAASLIPAALAAHGILVSAASWASFAAAALLLAPPVRERTARWTAALDSPGDARLGKAAFGLGGAAALWLTALKALQYRAFQLPMDSTIIVNTAANVLRGAGLSCTVDGTPSALTVHFAFFAPVFLSPLLWLWKSALPLLLCQAAAVGSLGLGAYLFARRWTGSAFAGLVALWLALTHPLLMQLAAASLENAVFGPPLFVWGLVCAAHGRRVPAGLLWVLALTTREQFPFTLAGLGVYRALSSDGPRARRSAEGAAVVLAAAAVWFAEMRVVASHADALNAGYWAGYSQFGASSSEVVLTVLTRPDRVLAHVFWPPSRLAPYARLLAGSALLPLLDLGGLAALAVASTHHLLMNVVKFDLQNAAYSFGPLLFATACGLRTLVRRGRLDGSGRAWLAAAALAAGGWGLRGGTQVLYARMGEQFVRAAPPLVALVPDGAAVWADEYVGCWLAARTQLKLLLDSELPARFDRLLFRPDAVLVDKGTLLFLPPADRARVVGFLAREGYVKKAESGTLVLLEDPQARPGGAPRPVSLREEPGDAERAEGFLAAVMDSPQAAARLPTLPPALRYEPESAEQRMRFVQLLLQRGFAREAEAHAREALRLRPDLAVAHGLWGDVRAALGDAAGAQRGYRAALTLAPADGATQLKLANALLRGGRAQEALALYENALAGQPGNLGLATNRAAALLALGRRAEAKRSLEDILRADPGNALARRLLPAASAR